MSAPFRCLVACGALAVGTAIGPLASGSGGQDAGPANEARRIAELGLVVVPPPLDELEFEERPGGYLHARWRGTLDGIPVEVQLGALPSVESGIVEPEDVTDRIGPAVAKVPNHRFRDVRLVEGAFGWAPYAALVEAQQQTGTRVVARHVVLAGVLPEHGYYLWASLAGEPPAAALDVIREWIVRAVRFEGEPRDAEWTDEQALARWIHDAPDDIANEKELDKVIRTEHYIILTNAAGGASFGRAMEKNYKAIQKLYPFEEVKGRALMPVLLFRTPEQYYGFCTKTLGWSLENAQRSKGVAPGDSYATYYESPNDSVHLHESTHQIFANRLRLGGGGSWFQEGVAEYIAGEESAIRNLAKQGAKKGYFTPFREFMGTSSLLYSASADNVKGGSDARDNYVQAATIIAFLHQSKFGKKRFQDFLHAVGSVPGDVASIEAAIQSVYGVGLDELQAEWVEFWK